ncbi:hypothetical protein MESS4_800011 [Mesorhizobium sp. STM 4661]|nr:hypothetical protein MESS4_800011 [Mesorhizobium sp. STM 4661]
MRPRRAGQPSESPLSAYLSALVLTFRRSDTGGVAHYAALRGAVEAVHIRYHPRCSQIGRGKKSAVK